MRNVDILCAKAMKLAGEKHQGQTDKGGAKYVEHVKRVAARCYADETKIVAWLHDLLENTDVTPDYLLSMGFPQEVVDGDLCKTLPHSLSFLFLNTIGSPAVNIFGF